jgi:5-methyltetrahydropteroyltriglutamate--homocysteine methyltransferase
MWQKLNAGVDVPNYPQIQNMIAQFIVPIMDDDRTEAPLLIKEEWR